MSIIHKASVSPSKAEVIAAWLDTNGEHGPAENIGSYRFDDPEGEVGIEANFVRRGGLVIQVPLTYRPAPLPGGDVIATMQHSVLGERWIYDARTDPVALDCYRRALRGEQAAARLELWRDGVHVGDAESEVSLALVTDRGAAEVGEVRFTTRLGAPVTGSRRLVAAWDGGEGVVAAAG